MPAPSPTMRTLDEIISFQGRTRPDEIAAIAIGHPELTFRDIAERSSEFTAALRSHGVGPTDRVALLLPMGRDAGIAITLTMAAAAAAPLDPAAPPSVLAAIGERLRPCLAIVPPGQESLAAPLGCPVVALQPGLRLARGAAVPPVGMPGPDDVGTITATSGSTGLPRFVPRHHAQYFDVQPLVARHHALHPGARLLSATQPHHILGAAAFVKAVAAGACTVFAGSTAPAEVVAAIRHGRPTMGSIAPSRWEALLAAAADGPPVPRFERLISTAAPFPSDSARAVSALFGAPLHRDYGLTEALCLAFAGPDDEEHGVPRYRPMVPGSVSIAGPGGERLPPGEEGEIVARGPNVFHGYIGGDGSEFFPGGWFRTGDLGVMADDGSFIITGRLKHLINRGGEKISPAAIEQALLSHPEIIGAAVLPVAHPTLGEDLEGVVVVRPGATIPPRVIRRWLLDRIPASHVPRAFSFRDSLPLTTAGKVDRSALVAELTVRSTR